MLDDDAGGPARKRLHALQRRVGIGDVVVGEFLALQLARGRYRGLAGIAIHIESCLLMRILAVAQLLLLDELEREGPWKAFRLLVRVIDDGTEPVGDGRIIRRRARVGFLCQLAAQLERGGARVRLHLGKHARIVGDIDDDRDRRMVLGRPTDHRGPADIDVLDAILVGGAFRDGRLEWIEIDDEEIDRRDDVCPGLRLVLGIAADGEQSTVNRGMQGLQPPIHHLWKAGVVGDVLDR